MENSMLKSIDEYERIRILYMNQKDVVKLALRCLEIRVFKLLQSKYVTSKQKDDLVERYLRLDQAVLYRINNSNLDRLLDFRKEIQFMIDNIQCAMAGEKLCFFSKLNLVIELVN